MPRFISSAMGTAVGSPYTLPGYFVEIEFSVFARMCSRGATSWDGKSWVAIGLRRPEYSTDVNGAQRCALRLTSVDQTMLSLVLNEGVADKPIKIWSFDASALAVDDPILEFFGTGDEAQGDATSLVIRGLSRSAHTEFAPRKLCVPANGFHFLPRLGQTFTWGDETFEIE